MPPSPNDHNHEVGLPVEVSLNWTVSGADPESGVPAKFVTGGGIGVGVAVVVDAVGCGVVPVDVAVPVGIEVIVVVDVVVVPETVGDGVAVPVAVDVISVGGLTQTCSITCPAPPPV